MYVSEIEISNYKSFCNIKNRMIFERYVTALIGKNESGKSNLLDAMNGINMVFGMNDKYFSQSCRNRTTSDEIGIKLTLEPDNYDFTIFGHIAPTVVNFYHEN